MIGDWFLKALLVQYGVASLVYLLIDHAPWKALYWLGAGLITVAVLRMR